MQKTSRYSGIDNLVEMTAAPNYNQYQVETIMDALPDETVEALDFGAGLGGFADELCRRGKRIICIEKDKYLLDKLLDRGLEAYESFDSIVPNSISFIYSLNTLEHIENDRLILTRMHQSLTQDGCLLLFLPAFQVLYSSMDKKVGHHRRYNKHNLLDKLKETGFVIETCNYCDSIGFLASLVYKYIGNKDGDINAISISIYDRWLFPLSRTLDYLLHSWMGKNIWVLARKA